MLSLIASVLFSASAIAALSVSGWWLWHRFSRFGRLVNGIAGPDPLPLVGSALDIMGGCDVILKMMHQQWPSTYGEIYRVFIGSKVYAVLSSPELIERVLNSSDLLDKGSDYPILGVWLGDGLLISSGAKWKSRRRLLTPAFHFHILNDFFDTFNEQSAVLCSKIDALCSADGRTEIQVDHLLSLCALDIICESAMGSRINAQTQESDYVTAVHRMAKIMLRKMMEPWNGVEFIFQATPLGREFRKCMDTLHGFTDRVIQKRRQEFDGGKHEEDSVADDFGAKKRRPFLDLLLEASADGTVLTDRDIREEVDTFMFEGHDTTAQAMTWFLYCMATNPHIQERVHEELDDVFGASDRPCTREDLVRMKYFECCIKESLRLYPSVPAVARITTEETQIGEHLLPVGCDINISIYALHRNPRIYPDPLVFDPERFTPENSVGRHPYAFVPFSAGSRNCIGQRFAMSEEKVVLSSLLRRFKFELSATAPKPQQTIELTLRTTGGVHLFASRR